MKVLLVGHDFDFSAGGGISRYASELYEKLKHMTEVSTVSTGSIPRPLRAFMPVPAWGYDVVHVIYRNVTRVIKGNAKMVTMWHDLMMIKKYSSTSQYKHRPKLAERYNIASGMIRNWVLANYTKSEAVIAHTSMVINDVKNYTKSEGVYDSDKLYRKIPPGLDEKFLKAKVWAGERKDFVYVGDIHMKHKNLDGLLESFNSVAKESDGARLHIFTKSPDAEFLLGERLPKLSNLSRGNVILHVRASDGEIIEILRRAVACLHLSREEGFGVPILESMAVGTPVVVLRESHIPKEVTRYATKAREDEVHKVVLKLLQKPSQASDTAVKYAKSFTWEEAAEKTLAVYKEISKES